MEQEQVQVYGEVIPLVDVVGGPGVNARLPADVGDRSFAGCRLR